MIVICDYIEGPFGKSGKLHDVLQMMSKSYKKAFLTRNDYCRFTRELENAVSRSEAEQEVMVKSYHKSIVLCSDNEKYRGCERTGLGFIIAELRWLEVNDILEYDDNVDSFFDVSDRLNP